MKTIYIFLILLIVGVFSFPNFALARIGVGVNTGKIQVDEKLSAGQIYQLPSITVINTGDEESDYEVSVSYHQDQSEQRPDENWFIFTPQKFHLQPGEAQAIEIKINLPLRIEPGNYFAYLEGHPLATVQKGGTTLGVAAAAKLYFTVVPANILYAMYYKVTSFFTVFAPLPQRILVVLVVLSLLVLFKRFFNININIKKTKETSPPETTKDA